MTIECDYSTTGKCFSGRSPEGGIETTWTTRKGYFRQKLRLTLANTTITGVVFGYRSDHLADDDSHSCNTVSGKTEACFFKIARNYGISWLQ